MPQINKDGINTIHMINKRMLRAGTSARMKRNTLHMLPINQVSMGANSNKFKKGNLKQFLGAMNRRKL